MDAMFQIQVFVAIYGAVYTDRNKVGITRDPWSLYLTRNKMNISFPFSIFNHIEARQKQTQNYTRIVKKIKILPVLMSGLNSGLDVQ